MFQLMQNNIFLFLFWKLILQTDYISPLEDPAKKENSKVKFIHAAPISFAFVRYLFNLTNWAEGKQISKEIEVSLVCM